MQLYTYMWLIGKYIGFIILAFIEILILTYFVKETIRNFKKSKQQYKKNANNVQARLEKANRQYYKQFK